MDPDTDALKTAGIDVAAGLKRIGGKRERYEALLRKFAEQQAGTVEVMWSALAAGDTATAERAAHSLKGAAATLGAVDLSKSAAEAETAIKADRYVDEALESLSLAFAAVQKAVQAALPEKTAGNVGGQMSGEATNVQEPLARLKQLLENDDSEAADLIVEAKSRLSGVLTPTELEMLTESVGKFDFETALKCLSTIASRLSLNLKGK